MPTIMLVEDEALERQAMRTIIEGADLDVEIVAETDNGTDALQLMKQFVPDLVFVDIRIPKLNGLDFIEQAKAMHEGTDFVVISAYDNFGFARRAIAMGVVEFFLKPVRRQDIVELLKRIINKHGQSSGQTFSPAISEAIRYLEENYASDIALADVAASIPLNPFYLSRQFKKETNVKFTDYLMKIRIDKAKELLAETTESITDIAAAVGYHDSNYFSTVFKRMEGISPRDFRKAKQ